MSGWTENVHFFKKANVNGLVHGWCKKLESMCGGECKSAIGRAIFGSSAIVVKFKIRGFLFHQLQNLWINKTPLDIFLVSSGRILAVKGPLVVSWGRTQRVASNRGC